MHEEAEPILRTIKRSLRGQLLKYPRLHGAARKIKNTIKRIKQLASSNSAAPTAPPAPIIPQKWFCTLGCSEEYDNWIKGRQIERQSNGCVPSTPGLFSILTTVWNTPVAYLAELADSLFNQRNFHDFEWILLDNGSTDADVRTWLSSLIGNARTKLFRVEDNLGIVGGMRYCLERATGRYILPVDSDDLLYPDALQVVAYYIRKHLYPPLLYSDEDKIQDGRYLDAYLKPSWDPVLFLNSCYIAHLGAFDRELALSLNVYSDLGANGCHDWDTFIRFMLAGHQPIHVPEVLYSWRMHSGSCASNIDSKSYIHSSHKHVLGKFLAAHPQGRHYRVEQSPLFPGSPDWWFRRERVNPRPLLSVVLMNQGESVDPRSWRESAAYPLHEVRPLTLESGVESLYWLAEGAKQQHGLIQFVAAGMNLEGSEWPWEVLALMELHPDVVMVGGRVLDESGRIVTAGEVLGFAGSCGCPDEYRPGANPGYFAQMWKQRSVSAVSTLLAVVDAAFLADFLSRHRTSRMSLRFLGAWLGAHAWRTGKRVVYTPHMTGRLSMHPQWYAGVTQAEKDALATSLIDLLPDTRYYPCHMSLKPDTPYELATQVDLQAMLPRRLARSA